MAEIENPTAGSAASATTEGFVPVGVDRFDDLIEKHGVERGSTLLVAGGCGTGKSTFTMGAIYAALQRGEKAIYITFEEPAEKLKKHMKQNFGWDLYAFEKKGTFALLELDPFRIARTVEAAIAKRVGSLLVQVEEIKFPFYPDLIVIDSLTALSVAFMGIEEHYRVYVRFLFDILEKYHSVNYVISETTLDPGIYSKSGIEEFLADGVIVLYNIREGDKRERAIEILKMRFSNHIKRLVPFQITEKGIKIMIEKEPSEKMLDLKESLKDEHEAAIKSIGQA